MQFLLDSDNWAKRYGHLGEIFVIYNGLDTPLPPPPPPNLNKDKI